MVDNALYLLALVLNKVSLVANDDYPHCLAGVVAHLVDPMLHLLERLRTGDVVHRQHDPRILIVDLGNGAVPLLSGRIPYLKGNPLSIFELLLLLMINCSKGGLNDVEVAIFVDVSMDDAGLADPGMPDNHDLDLLALHRICSRNDVIIYQGKECR